MTRFLARRLLNYLVLLALASFIAYVLAAWQFNPLENLLSRNPRPPDAVIEAKRVELHLDRPLLVQFGLWASGVVQGDFGTTVSGQPVGDELWRRVGVSLRLLVLGS